MTAPAKRGRPPVDDLRRPWPIRLGADEKYRIEAGAKAAGANPSTWARETLLRAADRLVREAKRSG